MRGAGRGTGVAGVQAWAAAGDACEAQPVATAAAAAAPGVRGGSSGTGCPQPCCAM